MKKTFYIATLLSFSMIFNQVASLHAHYQSMITSPNVDSSKSNTSTSLQSNTEIKKGGANSSNESQENKSKDQFIDNADSVNDAQITKWKEETSKV